MSSLRPDVKLMVLDWAELLDSDPNRIGGALKELMEGLASGVH